MSGSAAGPLSPAAYSPSNTAAGARLWGRGVREQPTPAADFQMAEASRKAWPASVTCPRGLWEEDRVGREGTGARPAQIQDDAVLACWVPCELGDHDGSQQLVRPEAEASLEIPLRLPSPGMRGHCEVP